MIVSDYISLQQAQWKFMKKKSKLEQLEIEYESLICKMKSKDLEMRQLREMIKQTKVHYEAKISKQDEHIAFLEQHLDQKTPLSNNNFKKLGLDDKSTADITETLLKKREESKHASKTESKKRGRNVPAVEILSGKQSTTIVSEKGTLSNSDDFCGNSFTQTVNYSSTHRDAGNLPQIPLHEQSVPKMTHKLIQVIKQDEQNLLEIKAKEQSYSANVKELCAKEKMDDALFKVDPDVDLALLNSHFEKYIKQFRSPETHQASENSFQSTSIAKVEPISPTYTTPNTPVFKKTLPNEEFIYISASEIQDLRDQIELYQMTVSALEARFEELTYEIPVENQLLRLEDDYSPLEFSFEVKDNFMNISGPAAETPENVLVQPKMDFERVTAIKDESKCHDQMQLFDQSHRGGVYPTLYSIARTLVKLQIQKYRQKWNI
ncbi:hypothetical protein HDV06_000007 [Boothiomyces sp. JEL0866]|nr:hypothetical protein HDV06_000007 [Boothiomyces sp. JEL0866]